MIDFEHNALCTGCSACVSICPANCLTFVNNEEGFPYPKICGNCLNCSKCERTCPLINEKEVPEKYVAQQAYAVCTKDKKNYKASTSGGLFLELCRGFGDSNTVVFGCAMKELTVFQMQVEGVENAAVFSKSKYIESEPRNTFTEAKEALGFGKKVIYSGTPCLIAGLKAFLQRDYPNLLTIDLICHGVGSKSVFDECMKVNEEEFGRAVRHYSFREKVMLYGENYLSKYLYKKTTRYKLKDRYNQLYLHQLCIRNSCGPNCAFRTSARHSDVTIADFKNFSRILHKRNWAAKKYSTLIINTEKGNAVWEAIRKRVVSYDCSLEDIKKYNPLFFATTSQDISARNRFFAEFIKGSREAVLHHTKFAQEHSKMSIFFKNIFYRGFHLIKKVKNHDNI